jgi:N-acetylmuramoyl-L-alanine amidase
VLGALVVWAALSLGLLQGGSRSPGSGQQLPPPISSLDGSGGVVASASVNGTSGAADVEVPLLVGKSVKVAEALVTGAGLTVVTRVANPAVAGAAPDTVVEQRPAPGVLVNPGSEVVITYQAGTTTRTTEYVVVIDAGHQKKANLALEPIGPGSTDRKAKVTGGATGVSTKTPEYKLTLAISLKLQGALVSRGVKVVMVRTTDDVDIPNSQRAKIGNDAKADLVVRVHLNGSNDNSTDGITTLYPAGNSWVTAITSASKKAATAVQTAVLAATGAASRGVTSSSIMTGFNFSTRPTIIVECGFLSNTAEDKLVGTATYQQKIADGIATGVMSYLEAR